MNDFQVWAPRAGRVEVEIGGRRHPLALAGDGWFRAHVDHPAAGRDYAFSVDGGEPRPDPRSAWQPFGVHGPSRLYDHAEFHWTDQEWNAPALRHAVMYELHIGTFTDAGTFDGAIGRLDHLVDLGINAIEIMPVHEFTGKYGWGYDGVDLFAPHHAYGGPDGLKRLVDAAHSRGIAVVLDVVYNHAGIDGNYLDEFGPYFNHQHRTPWGSSLNTDGEDNHEVRRFVIDNALMWLREYHIDGLRLDAIDYIADTSPVHLLQELGMAVDDFEVTTGRRCWVIAESDRNDPVLAKPREDGGYGLDAQWSDDFHHAVHAWLTGERDGYYVDYGDAAEVERAFRDIFVYADRYSPFRNATRGVAPTGMRGEHFVVCIQNHDQIGNRAVGERLGALVARGQLRIAAALLLFAPFVPLLFMGEEWAAGTPFQYFVDHDEEDLREAVRRGRVEEWAAFGWDENDVPDPGDPETFARSRLDWSELDAAEHAAMYNWYRSLIRLRRDRGLGAGPRELDVAWQEESGQLVVRRGQTMLVANSGASEVAAATEATRILLASASQCRLMDGILGLPPHSVAIVALD